jgi:hypothetical protein
VEPDAIRDDASPNVVGAGTAVERVVGKLPSSQRARPAVNETRSHRLTLTISRCEIRPLESFAFGLGVLRAGRTGDAGAGCLRRQLLLCGAFSAIAITAGVGSHTPFKRVRLNAP